jgi:hypothetical protein
MAVKHLAILFTARLLLTQISSSSLDLDAQGEIAYLVNCGDHCTYNTAVDYADVTKSWAGEAPSAMSRLLGSCVHWEGCHLKHSVPGWKRLH